MQHQNLQHFLENPKFCVSRGVFQISAGLKLQRHVEAVLHLGETFFTIELNPVKHQSDLQNQKPKILES